MAPLNQPPFVHYNPLSRTFTGPAPDTHLDAQQQPHGAVAQSSGSVPRADRLTNAETTYNAAAGTHHLTATTTAGHSVTQPTLQKKRSRVQFKPDSDSEDSDDNAATSQPSLKLPPKQAQLPLRLPPSQSLRRKRSRLTNLDVNAAQSRSRPSAASTPTSTSTPTSLATPGLSSAYASFNIAAPSPRTISHEDAAAALALTQLASGSAPTRSLETTRQRVPSADSVLSPFLPALTPNTSFTQTSADAHPPVFIHPGNGNLTPASSFTQLPSIITPTSSFGQLMQADTSMTDFVPTGHYATPPISPNISFSGSFPTALVKRPPIPKDKPFNLLTALCSTADIMFLISQNLDLKSFETLFTTSRAFHTFISGNLHTYIPRLARVHAPHVHRTLHWRNYLSLTVPDPAGTRNAEKPDEVRSVPTFRWLKMVVWRETVIRWIWEEMRANGLRLPRKTMEVMGKIWWLMDAPYNGVRIGAVHNKEWMSDDEVYLGVMLCVKLDMRMRDIFKSNVRRQANVWVSTSARRLEKVGRKMLMANRTLTVLWRVLTGQEGTDDLDLMIEWVRWKGTQSPAARARGETLFGLDPEEIGQWEKECWGLGKSTSKLIRPDECILRESMRREMGLDRKYSEMALWGKVDGMTDELVFGRYVPPPDELEEIRRDEGLLQREE